VKTESSQYGETFTKIQTSLPPTERVASGQAEKVACGSIVHAERITLEVTRASRLGTNLLTSLDERHVVREDGFFALGLEVQSGLARERSNQGGYHRGKKSKERFVVVVLSALPSLAKTGFVRKGAQRMNVSEEVIDQHV